jgi:hypothetical protein
MSTSFPLVVVCLIITFLIEIPKAMRPFINKWATLLDSVLSMANLSVGLPHILFSRSHVLCINTDTSVG